MGMNIPVGAEFEVPPTGLTPSRCFKIVDTGTHRNDTWGSDVRKVNIYFELPELKRKDGEPFIIMGSYTKSLNKKANLRKMLTSWRGKDFASDEEAGEFELEKILNAPGYINIVHKDGADGNTYANISSISPLPAGVQCPALTNKQLVFSLTDFKEEVFAQLSEKMQKWIMMSNEWKEKSGGGIVVANEKTEGQSLAATDDVPF